MREKWTEERLDDLMNARFGEMQRLTLRVGAGIFATMVVSLLISQH